MSTHILVIGATGSVGSHVVNELAAQGAAVSALTRNPEKAQAKSPAGVRIVRGDLGEPDTLAPALEGAGAILLSSSPDPHQAQLQSNLIQAARQAGVRYIVKISSMGADVNSPVNLCRWHGETERELAQSGIPHTNLRPNFFMQNMLFAAGTIQSQGAFYACTSEGKASFVDVRDIAAVAVTCLVSEGHAGKTYTVTGPEALSMYDVAAKLSAAVGKEVKYVDMEPAALKQTFLNSGIVEWRADGRIGLYQECAAGRFGEVTDVVRAIGHKQPVTFDQFAREHAAAFRGKGTAA
jgi:uncharacterized protein YbjT (DUF2867 family)